MRWPGFPGRAAGAVFPEPVRGRVPGPRSRLLTGGGGGRGGIPASAWAPGRRRKPAQGDGAAGVTKELEEFDSGQGGGARRRREHEQARTKAALRRRSTRPRRSRRRKALSTRSSTSPTSWRGRWAAPRGVSSRRSWGSSARSARCRRRPMRRRKGQPVGGLRRPCRRCRRGCVGRSPPKRRPFPDRHGLVPQGIPTRWFLAPPVESTHSRRQVNAGTSDACHCRLGRKTLWRRHRNGPLLTPEDEAELDRADSRKGRERRVGPLGARHRPGQAPP